VTELHQKCGELECNLSEVKRHLEMSKAEVRVIKEESTQHLTRMHELKEANQVLSADLQDSVDQGQDLRGRVMELGKFSILIMTDDHRLYSSLTYFYHT
jgi:citron Rho-interacting kinase